MLGQMKPPVEEIGKVFMSLHVQNSIAARNEKTEFTLSDKPNRPRCRPSAVARESDVAVPRAVGRETALASTEAFIGQSVVPAVLPALAPGRACGVLDVSKDSASSAISRSRALWNRFSRSRVIVTSDKGRGERDAVQRICLVVLGLRR